MSLTLSQIIDTARVQLADSTGESPFWSDADLTSVANQAINEIIPLVPKSIIPYYAGDSVFNITSGTNNYALDGFTPSAVKLHTVDAVYLNDVFCRPTTRDQIRLLNANVFLAPSVDAPFWWQHEDKIYIAPTPTADIASGLDMAFRIQPDALVYTVLTGTVNFRDSFLPALGLLTAGRAKIGPESAEEGIDLVKGAYALLSALSGYEIKLRSEKNPRSE